MLAQYHTHITERAAQGLPPLPLNAEQSAALVELLKSPPSDADSAELLHLLRDRIPAGVDQAAYVKAAFLADIAKGQAKSPLVDAALAVELLGTMLGGYNVQALVELLSGPEAIAALAAQTLAHTILVFDAFHDVDALAKQGKIGRNHPYGASQIKRFYIVNAFELKTVGNVWCKKTQG